MRSLKNFPNVNAPTITYPWGQIKDDDGSGTVGTPVKEATCGDQHQFFAQLMQDGGMVYNELPENEYNGFQLNTALANFIDKLAGQLMDAQWGPWTTLSLINGWAGIAGDVPQYRINNRSGKVEFRGEVSGASATNAKMFNAISSLIAVGSGGAVGRGFAVSIGGNAVQTATLDITGFLSIPTGAFVNDLTLITYYNK